MVRALGDRFTRERFLLGAAAVVVLGRNARSVLGATPADPNVQRFASRPDLMPPVVTVIQHAAGTAAGYLFLAPSSGPGQRGAMIVDGAGELVWFHPTTPSTVMNLRVALYPGRAGADVVGGQGACAASASAST